MQSGKRLAFDLAAFRLTLLLAVLVHDFFFLWCVPVVVVPVAAPAIGATPSLSDRAIDVTFAAPSFVLQSTHLCSTQSTTCPFATCDIPTRAPSTAQHTPHTTRHGGFVLPSPVRPMLDHDTVKAVVAAGEALCVAVLSVPALIHLITRSRAFKVRYETPSGFYQDSDGEATEQSMLEYTDWPSRVAAWLSSGLGLAAAITAGVTDPYADTVSQTAVLLFWSRWADVIAWVRES